MTNQYSILFKQEQAHDDAIWSVAWGTNKKENAETVVTGSLDDLVKVWKWRDERLDLQWSLEGHQLGVVSVDISHTLPIAASSSLDAHIRLWDLENGKQIKSIDAGPGASTGADGRWRAAWTEGTRGRAPGPWLLRLEGGLPSSPPRPPRLRPVHRVAFLENFSPVEFILTRPRAFLRGGWRSRVSGRLDAGLLSRLPAPGHRHARGESEHLRGGKREEGVLLGHSREVHPQHRLQPRREVPGQRSHRRHHQYFRHRDREAAAHAGGPRHAHPLPDLLPGLPAPRHGLGRRLHQDLRRTTRQPGRHPERPRVLGAECGLLPRQHALRFQLVGQKRESLGCGNEDLCSHLLRPPGSGLGSEIQWKRFENRVGRRRPGNSHL